MKKLLAILLSALCIFSLTTVCAFASEEEEYDFTEVLISSAVTGYLETAELYDGYFALGEAPSAEVVMRTVIWDIAYGEEDYSIAFDEDTYVTTYKIPAEVLENVAFMYFTESDALIGSLHGSAYYDAQGECYIVDDDFEYNYDAVIPKASLYGYEMLNEYTYEAYAALLNYQYEDDMSTVIPYEIKDGDVEGLDYLYVYNMWLEEEPSIEDDMTEPYYNDLEISYGYIPVELVGYVKSVITVDNAEMLSTLSSYEKIVDRTLYESETMVPVSESQLTEDMGSFVAMLLGSFVTFDENTFDHGTVVTSELITGGEVYENAIAAIDGVAENYVVYEMTASLDGEMLDPDGEVKALFVLPIDADNEVKVYHVANDGSVSEIDFSADYELGIVSVALSKLGAIVIGEPLPVVEEPEDTTEPEVEETTAPDAEEETTAPDAEEETTAPEVEGETTAPEADETTVPETTKTPETTKPAQKPQSPQTGDNMMLAIVIASIALAACSAVVVYRRKVR